ncbi:MAG: nitrilase-related carbon-nitrogen hydrolase, partial [bacterium]
IQTTIGKLGVMVCWDQWFPEAARLMALAGAQLLIYPTAIGWDPTDSQDEKNRQLEAWQIIQRSHAVANSIPIIAVNRCGFETDNSGHSAGIQFWGNSFIAGPQGEIIEQAGQENQTIQATIKLHKTEQIRRIWPFLRDRRIDSYAGLTQRYLD